MIPKLAVAESLSFSIISHDGKFYFKDFSAAVIGKVPNVRLTKSLEGAEVLYPLHVGDCISFFNNIIYQVAETADRVRLNLVKELAPLPEGTADYLPPA